MELFWELSQQSRIRQAESDAERAGVKARNVAQEVTRIDQKLERLALACQAMWEVVSERAGVTKEEVVAQMELIDLRDGRLDGKIGTSVLDCGACNRKNNSRRTACLYCGATLDRPHLFE